MNFARNSRVTSLNVHHVCPDKLTCALNMQTRELVNVCYWFNRNVYADWKMFDTYRVYSQHGEQPFLHTHLCACTNSRNARLKTFAATKKNGGCLKQMFGYPQILTRTYMFHDNINIEERSTVKVAYGNLTSFLSFQNIL